MVEVAESPFRKESVSSELSDYNGIEEQLEEMQISLDQRKRERDIRRGYFDIRLKEIRNRADKLQKNRIERLHKDGILIDLDLIKADSKVHIETEKKPVAASIVNIVPDTTIMNHFPEPSVKRNSDADKTKLEVLSGNQLVSSVKEELAKLKLNVPLKSQKPPKGHPEKASHGATNSDGRKGSDAGGARKSIVPPVAVQSRHKNNSKRGVTRKE